MRFVRGHTGIGGLGVKELFAFDRASVRSIDKDGRLHIATAHISKATVNEYKGSEIPNAEELGLEPTKLYRLFRDPEELRKAAPTFNNLPVLSKHVAVSADAPRKDLIVGTTGSEASFDGVYLDNSLAFWDGAAIEKILDDEERQLSCAYHYVPVLETGDYLGRTYDLRMTQIVGNHVALVKEGRAGADVIVGDEKPRVESIINLEIPSMPKSPTALSRKAQIVRGALKAYLPQKLASDAKIDLLPILAGVTAANFAASKATIVSRLERATKGKLAKDANLKDVHGLLDRLDGEGDAEEEPSDPGMEERDVDPEKTLDNPAVDEDGGCEKVCSFLQGKVAPEVIEQVRKMMAGPAEDGMEDDMPTTDADPKMGMMTPEERLKAAKDKKAKDRKAKDVEPGAGGMVAKGAMDAAIAKAKSEAVAEAQRTIREVTDAIAFVRPWVGEVRIAADSATGVYAKALDIIGVKTKGKHPDSFRDILEAQPKPGARNTAPKLGADSSVSADVAKAFPNAGRLKIVA